MTKRRGAVLTFRRSYRCQFCGDRVTTWSEAVCGKCLSLLRKMTPDEVRARQLEAIENGRWVRLANRNESSS